MYVNIMVHGWSCHHGLGMEQLARRPAQLLAVNFVATSGMQDIEHDVLSRRTFD